MAERTVASTGARRRGHRLGAVLALALAVAPILVEAGPASGADPATAQATEDESRGLVYDGLRRESAGPCAGLYSVSGTQLCTHGPDPSDLGTDVRRDSAAVSAALSGEASGVSGPATQAACDGDGVTGDRVHVLYVRASDRPDRFDQLASIIRTWANGVDDIFLQSAQETGGLLRIRYVHDASCQPVVTRVNVASTADDTFAATIQAVQAQGFARADRKYMMFVDANVLCGIGNIRNDDRPGQDNPNNTGPAMYGRTDAGCWGSFTPAHELMHNLGGVQRAAPNSSWYSGTPDGWHCEDDNDVMCYRDGEQVVMRSVCPDPAHEWLFDCRHDDYFNTATPRAGTYLATRWNTARSRWFIPGAQSIWGYVWANDPIAGSYTPSTLYQFNSRGATNTISRLGTGRYTVNMPLIGAAAGIAHATAYGANPNHCKVVGWGPSGTTLQVGVQCFTTGGSPVDTTFSAEYARPIGQGPFAHVWANQPTAASYVPHPSYSYNSTRQQNSITRSGTGAYAVRLPGLGTTGGHVQVTAYGSGSERCKVGGWAPDGLTQQVQVRCTTAAGRPVDTFFTLSYANGRSMFGLPSGEAGYARAAQPTTASYAPNAQFAYSSTHSTIAIARSAVGRYAVTFGRMTVVGGNVQVTAVGAAAEHCKVVSWFPVGTSPTSTQVDVACYRANGAPVDTRFDVAYAT